MWQAYRTVGTLKVSPIGLGCMSMSFGYGPPQSVQGIKGVIDAAIERGVNFFDTAALYGNGHNEIELSKVIAPFRNKVFICTKGGMTAIQTQDGRKRKIDSRPQVILQNCEESLRRLNVETIDLYYLHRWDKTTPIEDVAQTMGDLIRAGKIRNYGLSEVSAATLRRAHETEPIAAVQSEYSLWTRNPEIAILPTCETLGIALVAFSPLARGFLSFGSPDPKNFDDKDFRCSMPRFQSPHYEINLALRARLKELSDAANCSPSQVLLAWLLNKSAQIVPIPGTTQVTHLHENMQTLECDISEEILRSADILINQNTVAGERYDPIATAQVDTENF